MTLSCAFLHYAVSYAGNLSLKDIKFSTKRLYKTAALKVSETIMNVARLPIFNFDAKLYIKKSMDIMKSLTLCFMVYQLPFYGCDQMYFVLSVFTSLKEIEGGFCAHSFNCAAHLSAGESGFSEAEIELLQYKIES